MTTAVNIDNVSIVFGSDPKRALPLMDKGMERAEIQSQTDQILGVHNCNLTVKQGHIHVLMGLSGSGKSTLLRAVNGLNPVVRGKVEVNDGKGMVDVTHCDAATLRRVRMQSVAMVFQQFGLLPWRTVRENVGLGLELAGMKSAEAKDRVDNQLELVGLGDWGDARVSALSGGMQQRVGLARAFATEAPILLMDEPFSALDPLIRTKLQDELLELQERLKRTILFVSHDLDEAFKLGNEISIMEGGRIVQSGAPQDIFTDPRNDYVAEFVQHMNPLGVLRVRDLMQPVAGTPTQTVAADTLVRDVFATLIASDAPVGVTDGGQLIGQLGKNDVLRGLAPQH
ncbi:choline ABC transporter ATP-binding protein [Salipiger pallidus]|uniref:Choline ABC transporter ATP-binding protein n=1 Tax=Salipiger pallidus TaxID=1775170 RepID=A0A8J3EF77_9RHOB|nr:choline ABC transporter ATP-binding protein [Salipiger pallidus]GGG62599.1 choline ABC transporter ATP-binding protein [Salipiger pallidus]